jgi:NADPH:quinone reductase-like Zn-dependent oxidoreductase
MQAFIRSRFGSPDVLSLQDAPIPPVGPGEVRVRVRATSANPWDWHFLRGTPYIARLSAAGFRRPKHTILGGDIAGEVDAVGPGVSRFRPGDAVFGFIGFGGYAEYAVASEDVLAHAPAGLSFEEAATVPLAATTALQGLRDIGGIEAGQKVLIVGASGGVGSFAVQIAKALGAHVTGVASGANLDLLRSIVADEVIDYRRDDVTRSGERYDLILQLAGETGASAFRRILTPKGTLVLSSGDSKGRVLGPFTRIIRAVLLSKFVSQAIKPFNVKPNAADLDALRGLIESGRITPVVERTYPFSQLIDAIRHVESGRARGKVAISVAPAASGAASAASAAAIGASARAA